MNYSNDYTGYINDVLYRMCEEKPRHDDQDIVKSKLIIIGRTYSASIQRTHQHDFSFDNAAHLLIDSDIDAWIDKLNKIDRPSETNISEILHAHKYLVEQLAKATNRNNRSFASKYLHFHARKAVFLYDSRASMKVQECIKPEKPQLKFLNCDDIDRVYADFVVRCLYYRGKLEKQLGEQVTPRRIDNQLIGYWNPSQS